MSEIVLQGYLIKKRKIISQTDAEKIQNQSISAHIYAAITSALLGSGSIDSIKNSIKKGFSEGKNQVENLKNSIEYRSEYFQYGDHDSVFKIKEIENSPDFDRWIDSYIIDEIKKSII